MGADRTGTARSGTAQIDERMPRLTGQGRRRAPLWREVLGAVLRAERLGQRRILAEVAGDAGVSTQYLSEIERGRKEPSSEILAAVSRALGLTLLDVAARVAGELGRDADRDRGIRPVVVLDLTGEGAHSAARSSVDAITRHETSLPVSRSAPLSRSNPVSRSNRSVELLLAA